MTWTLKDLMQHCRSVHRETMGGQWVPARPEPGPWLWRLRAAWAVLRGRADAFTWPDAGAK